MQGLCLVLEAGFFSFQGLRYLVSRHSIQRLRLTNTVEGNQVFSMSVCLNSNQSYQTPSHQPLDWCLAKLSSIAQLYNNLTHKSNYTKSWAWQCMPAVISAWRLRRESCGELETSLGSAVSTMLAWLTQQSLGSRPTSRPAPSYQQIALLQFFHCSSRGRTLLVFQPLVHSPYYQKGPRRKEVVVKIWLLLSGFMLPM